jgi:hypothetical protein
MFQGTPASAASGDNTQMARNDFSTNIKEALAKRVAFCCSNPRCGIPTAGPHSDPTRALNIGAAHITAAAAGGPRFDASLTAEERASAENGIWLCQSCGKLVDNDVTSFPVPLLLRWKEHAETKALRGVRGATPDGLPQPKSAMHTPIPRIQELPYEEARSQLIDFGWQPKERHWSDAGDPDISAANGQYYWGKGFHEIVSACPTGSAPCTFAFQDVYGNVLIVSTVGEVIPEVGAGAIVARWRFQEEELQVLATETRNENASYPIGVIRRLTPPNILDVIPLGTPSEKVRERLGVPDLVDGNRWKYRFQDTQVEIAFDAAGIVQTLVIALVHNKKLRAVGAPFGDFVLGEITVNDLMEMGHHALMCRNSLRTKELVVPVRMGPTGVWHECFFGAMVVHAGVGWLAETDFQWNETSERLISRAEETIFNWVGIGTDDGEPPYFDWYIKT